MHRVLATGTAGCEGDGGGGDGGDDGGGGDVGGDAVVMAAAAGMRVCAWYARGDG